MAVARTQNRRPIRHTREQWLERRVKGIGASEVGAILGLSKWADHLEVWARKTGKTEKPPSTLFMRLGTHMEPFIDQEFQRETGMVTNDPGDFTVYQDAEEPRFFCTPDRLISPDHIVPVELKNVNAFAAADWEGAWAPLEYQAQLQFQMHILGADHGYLVGLLGGSELAIRRFDANINFQVEMMRKLHEFLGYVEGNKEPPADWNRQIAIDGFKTLHPDDNGETVQLPAELLDEITAWEEAKQDEKRAKRKVESFKAKLIAAIGDATFGEVGPYRFSYKTQSRDAYTVKPSKFRVLRQTKA